MEEKWESNAANVLQWTFAGIQGGSRSWLIIRKCMKPLYVTGSGTGNAVGVGYDSRQAYWSEKTQRKEKEFSAYAFKRMNYGTKWEDTVVETFANCCFKVPVEIMRPGIIYSPFMWGVAATPDGLIPQRNAILEVKCRWPATDTGEAQVYTTDDIPPSHLCQMVLEMHCSSTTRAYYVCMGLPLDVANDINHRGPVEAKFYAAEFKWSTELWRTVIHPQVSRFIQCIKQDVKPKNLKPGLKTFMIKRIRELFKPVNTHQFTRTVTLTEHFGSAFNLKEYKKQLIKV